MNEREAIIKFYPDKEEGETNAEITTENESGNVTDLEMIDFLDATLEIFCKRVVDEAKEIVGDDYGEMKDYIDWARKNQQLLRGE